MTESHQESPSEIRSFLVFIALLAVIGVIAALVSGCSSRPAGEGWVHETSAEGQVTTVRTLSGSVWGGTARLVEEASIGAVDVTEAADEYLLGSVNGLAVGEDRIYILDRQVPTVRCTTSKVATSGISAGREAGRVNIDNLRVLRSTLMTGVSSCARRRMPGSMSIPVTEMCSLTGR